MSGLKCRLCRAICYVMNKAILWRCGYRLSFTMCPVVFWWVYEPGVYDDDPRGKMIRAWERT